MLNHQKAGGFLITVCFLAAAIPKFVIGDDINVFLPEVFLILSLILFGVKPYLYLGIQRKLVTVFFLILVFSILAQFFVKDIGAILRSFKELLYISLVYWASILKFPDKFLKRLSYFGLLAMSVNLVIFFSDYSGGVINIWSSADSLSSGFSNKGFSLTRFEIVELEGLAHGIWGSYCVLVFIIATYLKSKSILDIKWWWATLILLAVSMGISVSRETLLIILVIVFCYIFFQQKKNFYKVYFIILFTLGIAGVFTFGSDLPIIQKLLYTQEALTSSGTEGNMQIRINIWKSYLGYIGDNFLNSFVGFGLSGENFYNNILPYSESSRINEAPESVIVYVAAFGGLFALLIFISFLVTCSILINRYCRYKLLKYYFFGLLLANIFTSVSMFSDLLYAHLCILVGIFTFNKNLNESITH